MKRLRLKGGIFQIRARWDTGGFKLIRVVQRIPPHALLVQDCLKDGSPAPVPTRRFTDSQGWPKLRKYWKPVKV